MRRVTEVIDCWYDSGAMPFAQWGYRGDADPNVVDEFEDQFPADFISEAIDQTRGWFYSLLAISTLLFGKSKDDSGNETHAYPHPFRNCIVLGLMLGEDGQKMSKSKRNYREPDEIFEKYGADALRWYFFANQPPWTSIRYSERAIKDSIPEFLLRLWNVYSFFVIYANIDGFDPSAARRRRGRFGTAALSQARSFTPVAKRAELDRWILSELHQTTAKTIELMDAYDNYGACAEITAFVDALSNWYVRRSRDRFWSGDKTDQTSSMPIGRSTSAWSRVAVDRSVHTFPGRVTLAKPGRSVRRPRERKRPPRRLSTAAQDVVDAKLSSRMQLLREIASMGRSARMNAKLKVRQPLAAVEVILADDTHRDWLLQHDALLRDETERQTCRVHPGCRNVHLLRSDPQLQATGTTCRQADAGGQKSAGRGRRRKVACRTRSHGQNNLDVDGGSVELTGEDVEVRLKAKAGWAAAQGQNCVVVLSTELTDALIGEGYRSRPRAVRSRSAQTAGL